MLFFCLDRALLMGYSDVQKKIHVMMRRSTLIHSPQRGRPRLKAVREWQEKVASEQSVPGRLAQDGPGPPVNAQRGSPKGGN